PGTLRPATRQVTFEQRNPTPRNEVQCYNCRDFGHISLQLPSTKCSLASILGSLGKRISRSDGARPAINVIVPAVSKSIRRPFIDAEVFRVGELKAMVDSGAKNSAISEGMLLGRS
ncbi:Uncharacterized protein APZ42_004851, partial [Daphnia magna]